MTLPKPGILGLLVRAVLAVVILAGLFDAIVNPQDYWDGFSDPVASLPLFIPLVLLSGWVVNELLQKKWGWKPNLILLAGAGIVLGIGAGQGNVWGAPIGYYVWAWELVFAGLLGPAFVLAVFLRTPGCEMRSYAHLRAKATGGDVAASVCPGWIDRLDSVRLFGRW